MLLNSVRATYSHSVGRLGTKFLSLLFIASACVSPTFANCAGGGTTTNVTSTDETSINPSSRQLVSGIGTVVDTTTPGQIAVNLASNSVGVTYMASTPQFVTPATPTDLIIFTGSATKTVKILKIRMCLGEGTAGCEQYRVAKRSTANTGGTLTTVTPVPVDSNNAAGTASLGYYTAKPTSLGTLVGYPIDLFLQTPIGTAGSSIQPPWFDLYDAPAFGQPLTLRGTNESLCLNNTDGLTHTGQVVRWEVIWTEE